MIRSIMACLLMIHVQACSDTTVPSGTPSSPDIGQLLKALASAGAQFASPQSPQWPRDLSVHPSMRSESFLLQAIIRPENVPLLADESPTASVMLQIDRVGLTSQISVDRADSAWRFSDIMRSDVRVDADIISETSDNDTETTHGNTERQGLDELSDQYLSAFLALATMQPRQSVQRVSLGLAGIEDNTLWVGNDRLSFDVLATVDNPCLRQYRWVATLAAQARLLLDFSMNTCPLGQSIALLSRWQQSSVQVSGFLLSEQYGMNLHLTPVEGVAWFSQRWGELPSAGGAVAIDTLHLQLDDQNVLEVSRSKRRSGRGPQTVSATLHTQSQSMQSVSLSWEDGTDNTTSASHLHIPQSIRLFSEDGSIDLRVSPLNRLTAAAGFDDDQLQGAVVVDGTHRGVGFLHYVAQAVSP